MAFDISSFRAHGFPRPSYRTPEEQEQYEAIMKKRRELAEHQRDKQIHRIITLQEFE